MPGEKEKMLSEQAYKASDKQLFEERLHAQKTCFDFNNISPELITESLNLIRGILGSVSSGFIYSRYFNVIMAILSILETTFTRIIISPSWIALKSGSVIMG
ncbi:maltose acetyltransferase domain-containing protein [Christiangramia portivictoriae]|uniref:maltose acetyltransferase domain-containing protein n=1 Tax=Christiangramia portivictoriae TaxID=326069 RepID=UPI0003FF9085|nr:maltose acetyltransferase domain-containing protein [Christiangramia portivictoriae]